MNRSFQALFYFLRLFTIFSMLVLLGCSGYRVRSASNPFESYKIKSLTVPMFVNHSNIAKASVPFTREIVQVLSRYPKLKVYQGESVQRRDAILIGIITTPKYRSESFKESNERFTDGTLKTSIGGRKEFFVPISSSYRVMMRLVLIKNPTTHERELVKTDLVSFLQTSPSKIIFNHLMILDGSFSREVGDTISSDSPGIVNFTKSKRNFETSLDGLAESAAIQFKDTVLDVF